LDVSVALAPWLGFSPERSSRSALNRRVSAARRPESGGQTSSAKAVRNSPASVGGNPIRSSGTWAGRRIATGSPTKNLPRAVLRPKGINAGAAGLVSTRRQIISSKGANDGRRPLSHVRVAILARAPTDLTVDRLHASAPLYF